MERMNIDFGFMPEAKITNSIYTRFAYGYQVLATEAVSPQKGGVVFFSHNRPCFAVESERTHGPNTISFDLVCGSRRSLVIGAYVSPAETDGSTLAAIELAHARHPQLPQILMGDLMSTYGNKTLIHSACLWALVWKMCLPIFHSLVVTAMALPGGKCAKMLLLHLIAMSL